MVVIFDRWHLYLSDSDLILEAKVSVKRRMKKRWDTIIPGIRPNTFFFLNTSLAVGTGADNVCDFFAN